MLRSELGALEHKHLDSGNDYVKQILEDIANLEKDFRVLSQND